MDYALPRLAPELEIALGVSLALSFFRFGSYLLYPFKIFTTWVHECCHAVMVLLVGGSVSKITLAPDTSGVTHFKIAPGRIAQGLVASAGYLGSCAMGCLLYFVSVRHTANSATIVLVLGALILLSLLFWVRNLFGALSLLLIGAALLYAAREPALTPWMRVLLPFLAIQTGLNSLYDLRVLFGMDPRIRSDARTMQSLYWLPAPVWACLWLLLSLALMAWTISVAGLRTL